MKLDWRPANKPENRTSDYFLQADLPGGGRAYIYELGGTAQIEVRVGDRNCQFVKNERGLTMAKRWVDRIAVRLRDSQ